MRSHVGALAVWALLVFCVTGCAEDDLPSEEADGDGDVTSVDAAVTTADASTAISAGEADAGVLDASSSSPSSDATVEADSAGPRADASMRDDAGGGGSDANNRDAGMRDAGSSTADAGSSRPDAGVGACPQRGALSYVLQQKSAPSSAEAMAYMKIRAAMDKAVEKYNCYTSLTREVRVSYDPSVATADGSAGGMIRFGSDASMHFVTAMHELGHVFGVGSTQYKPLVQNGVFTGKTAQAEMRRISGDAMATVKSDGTHFWPYGLNYVSEHKSEADLIGHCAIVVAIRTDLGM
jgi:hypothetical protein